jgi:hypothetical protein
MQNQSISAFLLNGKGGSQANTDNLSTVGRYLKEWGGNNEIIGGRGGVFPLLLGPVLSGCLYRERGILQIGEYFCRYRMLLRQMHMNG